MEKEKNVLRPQKPSRLRPPQVKIIKPQPLPEDITTKPCYTDSMSSKGVMRRSKSFSHLQHIVNKHKNMDGAIVSKMYKPALLKPRQPLSENIKDVVPTNTVTKSNMLSRRSKSTEDLQLIVNKPKVASKITCKGQKIGSGTAVNKAAQKRKAEKSSEEVKSKIVKQVKIPDWDYKGRYNQLREKYATLNEEHKENKFKLEELKVIEERYSVLKNDYDVIQNKYTALTHTSTKVITENNILKTRVSELNDTVSRLTRECRESQQLYEENLDNYNTLKADFNKKVTECDALQLDLTLASKRIIDFKEENIALKKDLNNGEIMRRKLHNIIQDLKGTIRVFCRVRPTVKSEEECLQCAINFIDEKTIEVRKSRESISAISGKPTDIKAEFTVDKIFGPSNSQQEIFEEVAQLVQSALDGYDICVFAYGQTGSGKTYTMQGDESPEKKGMIPRTVDLIFESIRNLKLAGWNYEISASFLEIYNENIRDLLNPNSNQNLEIRFNEGKGTTVTNLLIQKLNSAEELKNLMTIAQRNRAVAATDFNLHSSRSHAVTKIYLQGTNMEMKLTYTGSINLVDLAGSESAKTSSDARLAETKHINKSLSALESVMVALYNKEKHIPYRNSKLTYLLQSCLGGSSKTLMVVNIAPLEDCYTESIYSLRFASKVKEVKMNAKRNKTYFTPAPIKM